VVTKLKIVGSPEEIELQRGLPTPLYGDALIVKTLDKQRLFVVDSIEHHLDLVGPYQTVKTIINVKEVKKGAI